MHVDATRVGAFPSTFLQLTGRHREQKQPSAIQVYSHNVVSKGTSSIPTPDLKSNIARSDHAWEGRLEKAGEAPNNNSYRLVERGSQRHSPTHSVPLQPPPTVSYTSYRRSKPTVGANWRIAAAL